eukprot:m.32170 g.32170  ORF g.32170 m.32170 type:complete len:90 (+) comp8380_c0_seq4:51-320(+)
MGLFTQLFDTKREPLTACVFMDNDKLICTTYKDLLAEASALCAQIVQKKKTESSPKEKTCCGTWYTTNFNQRPLAWTDRNLCSPFHRVP